WTVAATATSRVRLNASTLSTFYYSPPHLARLLTTLDVLSDGRLGVGVGLGWMKDEYDAVRSADWHRRGKMLDDVLAFLQAWWATTPVSWDSEFFSLPPVYADLRPVQAGGPPIWIGGTSEAAMRRVGRSGTGWLGVEVPDADHLWSIARRAAQDAGRDPDALKTAMRINLEPGTSVDSLASRLTRFAESGIDEAFVDAFARALAAPVSQTDRLKLDSSWPRFVGAAWHDVYRDPDTCRSAAAPRPGPVAQSPRPDRPGYAQPLDVEALARGANMSAGHLSREFKLTYCESPYSYLMTRRIERAMALLRRGGFSVTEVCFAVGCSSLGTFSTRFTELVGMPPSTYRDQAALSTVGMPACVAKQVTRPVRNREAPVATRS
ncbi:MAG: hypothetical protein QOJ20_2161, partial [Mycobacterium sp.]|nr:hypothetical protein [Mycobacterium sp.]